MIGHRQIVEARRAGWKPSCVFLNIGPTPPRGRLSVAPESMLEQNGIPEVWTNGATPAVSDLRFLRGMRVHVSVVGGSREQFWAWWDAAVAAKPAHAIGMEPDGEVIEWRS